MVMIVNALMTHVKADSMALEVDANMTLAGVVTLGMAVDVPMPHVRADSMVFKLVMDAPLTCAGADLTSSDYAQACRGSCRGRTAASLIVDAKAHAGADLIAMVTNAPIAHAGAI